MNDIQPRRIELLAPARDIECGREAILHGADAVYIGGPAFGARAAAGNSIADIATLAAFAHRFGARVYVAFNTILYEHELADAERTVWELWRAGADALIVQDYGVLEFDRPPIPLHASTQMDTRTAEKTRFLSDVGFSQVVLARELSLGRIAAIHRAVPEAPLEVFVHGAVCVSYSGRCFASQYNFGRSANRGDCSQFCRLSFDLLDAHGRVLTADKHLLSLHDMNRSDSVRELIEAGVSSFKIEGRLKGPEYVKNITAHYRGLIDEVLADYPTLSRSSYGSTTLTFAPNPHKSFNRGFSSYFLHGRKPGQEAFDTPKAIGEYVGTVSEVRGRSIIAAGDATFANGDGLCFTDRSGKLCGFRVNRAEGRTLFPAEMPQGIFRGARLHRNSDQAFDTILAKPSAVRRMSIDIALDETPQGIALTLAHEDGTSITATLDIEKQAANTPQEDNIRRQLTKLGDTDFTAARVSLRLHSPLFIPSSALASLRRQAVEMLVSKRAREYQREQAKTPRPDARLDMGHLSYEANVSNSKARAFLMRHGATAIDEAMETATAPLSGHVVLMTCRHCLRYSHGVCPTHQGKNPSWSEPLALRSADGRTFPIGFDCQKCEMTIYAPR